MVASGELEPGETFDVLEDADAEVPLRMRHGDDGGIVGMLEVVVIALHADERPPRRAKLPNDLRRAPHLRTIQPESCTSRRAVEREAEMSEPAVRSRLRADRGGAAHCHQDVATTASCRRS